MDYIAQRVGARHVGIGLDFVYFEREFYDLVASRGSLYPAGYPPPPWQLVQPEQLPEATEELLRLGYGEDDVRGILGENWARVAEAVWK
jgi:membrane dipeptidase